MESNATSSSPLVECSDRQCNRSLNELFRKDSCFRGVTCRGREPGCFSSELESFSADTTSVTTSTQKPTTHNCFKGTFSFKHYKVKKVSTRRLCTVSGMTWRSAQLAPRQHKKKRNKITYILPEHHAYHYLKMTIPGVFSPLPNYHLTTSRAYSRL